MKFNRRIEDFVSTMISMLTLSPHNEESVLHALSTHIVSVCAFRPKKLETVFRYQQQLKILEQ